jgi:hypothetical protein
VNLFPLPAEAFNQPFSSQDTTLSTDSPPPNSINPHKRSYHDDDARPLSLSSNFLFNLPMKVAEDEVPVSPLSATPADILPQAALRPFAQPKTRRPQPARLAELGGVTFKDPDLNMDLDLENARQSEERVSGSSSDFDEAPFLQPWSSPPREVEMGGM